MQIYVVLHYGRVEKAFNKKEDALNYIFDGDDVGDMHPSDVGPATGGEWGMESCTLE